MPRDDVADSQSKREATSQEPERQSPAKSTTSKFETTRAPSKALPLTLVHKQVVDLCCEHLESDVDWDPMESPPSPPPMDITDPNEQQANQMHTVTFMEEHLSPAAQTVVMSVIKEAIMARFVVASQKVVHKVQGQVGSSIANSLRVILPQVRKLESAFINTQRLVDHATLIKVGGLGGHVHPHNASPWEAMSTRRGFDMVLQTERRTQKCDIASDPLFAEAGKV